MFMRPWCLRRRDRGWPDMAALQMMHKCVLKVFLISIITPYPARCAAARQVPAGHALAARDAVDVAELYALALVSLNRGSTVQAAQEAMLRRHGILWRHLNVAMARGPSSLWRLLPICLVAYRSGGHYLCCSSSQMRSRVQGYARAARVRVLPVRVGRSGWGNLA